MSDWQERCDDCGRYMKQVWFQATDEPDSWQDYWKCSQDAKHRERRRAAEQQGESE